MTVSAIVCTLDAPTCCSIRLLDLDSESGKMIYGLGAEMTGTRTGSADAFMNVHIQEARVYISPLDSPKVEDLVYSESATAAGDITLFQKVMNYKSLITAPGSGPTGPS
jgi:hypothetical protein